MPSKRFAGPLERVNECLWRIPKSYKRGMRVDGLIYADDALDRAHPRRPGGRAGGQRRLPAGNSAGQPGDARHSLGIRLLHRRRVCDRSGGRGRHLARRRRATTSIAACGSCGQQSERCRRAAGTRNARPRAVSQRADGGRPRRQVQVRPQRAQAICWSRGRSSCNRAGWRPRRDIEHTEARGCLAGAGPISSAIARSTGATTSAARSARATTFWRCRSSTACSTRRRPRRSDWRKTASA